MIISSLEGTQYDYIPRKTISLKGRPPSKVNLSRFWNLIEQGQSRQQISNILGRDRGLVASLYDYLVADFSHLVNSDNLNRFIWVTKGLTGDNETYGVGMLQGKRVLNLNVFQLMNSLGDLLAKFRLNVSKPRINESLNVIDPIGVALRRQRAVYRRIYHVAGPMSLWHMDGNHKLNSFGIVTHGCIDGSSSYILYLSVANENSAAFVCQQFVAVCNLSERFTT